MEARENKFSGLLKVLIEEITANDTNKYYRGFEIIKNNDGLYYLHNGQGDVAFLVNTNGTTVADYVFDAYGNQSEDNTIYNPFGYRGEYQDEESGLVYLRARMYDPTTGRFINEDPVKDGLNWYVYCSGNPIMFEDPLGLWEEGDEKYPNFIQIAIRQYTIDYLNAESKNDEYGMLVAHQHAESARMLGDNFVARKSWGAVDFNDWESDPIKNEIVIHHTNNNQSIKKNEQKHINKGWSGIGYHFVISKDGTVYEGRPLDKKGAHVDGLNTGKIGIVLIGDYHGWNADKLSDDQLISALQLVDILQNIYTITDIKGHRDYNGEMPKTETVCPGDVLYDFITKTF